MRTKIVSILLLVPVLLITACSPALPMVAQPSATPNIVETAKVLSTEVANTVISAFTQTAEAVLPTETPQPSSTPVADTATPTPGVPTIVMISPTAPATVTPSRVVVTIVAGPTRTPGPWNCAITKQAVKWGAPFPPGAEFDGRWTVKNTGTKAWEIGALSYFYVDGTPMQTHGDSFKVNKKIKPGDTLEIIVDMQAPREYGFYHTDWLLKYGDTDLCLLPVDIYVK